MADTEAKNQHPVSKTVSSVEDCPRQRYFPSDATLDFHLGLVALIDERQEGVRSPCLDTCRPSKETMT